MKQKIYNFRWVFASRIWAVVCLTMLPYFSQATYIPVTIASGFNGDVIANGTGPANTKTDTAFDNDAAQYVLMANGYNNGTSTNTGGLPTSGLINSAYTSGLTYQLANYDLANSMVINTTSAPATLTFQNPIAAGEVYLLMSSGSGASTVDVTVNFTSGSQTFTSISISDWYNGTNAAIIGIGRITRTTNVMTVDASNPRLYDIKLSIGQANWSNPITSITVTRTSASGRVHVMAVSVNDVCSGNPTGGTAVMTPGVICPSTSFALSTIGSSNGVGLSYQWETSASGANSWSAITNATTATFTVSAGITVATDYRLKITCSNGNGFSYSSVLTATPSTGLAGGTYTINSSVVTGGTNFQNFTDAVAALKCGISGPVVFNVSPGTYNEQITIPAITGTSATNTILFNGNNATLSYNITASGSNYCTMNLNGASYLTFKKLNIQALGSTYGFALHLMSNANYNTFDSCTITANATATATTSAALVMSNSTISVSTTGANGSNNMFSNSTISGGYYAAYFYGSSNTTNQNNSIVNCSVKDFYYYGVYYYNQGGGSISANKIERPTRTSVSTFYGLYLSTGCINVLAEKNILRNFSGVTANTNLSAYVIYVSAAASAGNENKVYNNIIYNTNNDGLVYGLYMSSGTYVKAYFNTISIDNSAATTGTVYGIYSSGTAGVDIKNNLVSITRGGSGAKYGLYFSGVGKTSNYNDIYLNAPAGTNYVGYYSSAFTTLANWQTANSGAWDQNSVSLDPMFT
ncbi:MAG: hypothetical protein JST52_11350, partial [Bacteroidetes bacterium]|nr:hypothetical protein [Bacteroidota bacterium]